MMIEEHAISAGCDCTDDLLQIATRHPTDGFADLRRSAAVLSRLELDRLANDAVLAVDLTTKVIYDDQTNFTLFDTTLSPTLRMDTATA